MSAAVHPLTTIGHITPRVDAMERVTGQAKYTNDLKLPGMLYARVLRRMIQWADCVQNPQSPSKMRIASCDMV